MQTSLRLGTSLRRLTKFFPSASRRKSIWPVFDLVKLVIGMREELRCLLRDDII